MHCTNCTYAGLKTVSDDTHMKAVLTNSNETDAISMKHIPYMLK